MNSTCENMCFENVHERHLQSMLALQMAENRFCDVTLACNGGQKTRVHGAVLCANSGYFDSVLAGNTAGSVTLVIMKDYDIEDIQLLIQFMYHGIVVVDEIRLQSLRKSADDFQIKGLIEAFRAIDETAVSDFGGDDVAEESLVEDVAGMEQEQFDEVDWMLSPVMEGEEDQQYSNDTGISAVEALNVSIELSDAELFLDLDNSIANNSISDCDSDASSSVTNEVISSKRKRPRTISNEKRAKCTKMLHFDGDLPINNTSLLEQLTECVDMEMIRTDGLRTQQQNDGHIDSSHTSSVMCAPGDNQHGQN